LRPPPAGGQINPTQGAALSVTNKPKKNDTADNFAALRQKKKRYNKQPTHKTAHLQAPTHKQMLQLAKELFSCRRTQAHPPPYKK
jgi:hypothetical protein